MKADPSLTLIPTDMVTAILSVANKDGHSERLVFNAIPYLWQTTPDDVRGLIEATVGSSPAAMVAIARWEAAHDTAENGTGVAARLATADLYGGIVTVDLDIEEAASFLLLNRPDVMLAVATRALMNWGDMLGRGHSVSLSSSLSINDVLNPSFAIHLVAADLFQAAPTGFYPRAAEAITNLMYLAGFVLGPDTALADLLDEHTVQRVFVDSEQERRGLLYRASGADLREAWTCETDASLRPDEEALQTLAALRTPAR